MEITFDSDMIKMPNNCHECLLGYNGSCFGQPSHIDERCPQTGRPDWCPIKIPKVMTWQEIVESANEYDGERFVWLESKKHPERVFPSILFKTWIYDSIATIITVMTAGWLFEGYKVEYNKRWRIWTEKPTEEQRKEVEWE